MKKNGVTIRVAMIMRKNLKKAAAELDISMMKASEEFGEILDSKEIMEIWKRKKWK